MLGAAKTLATGSGLVGVAIVHGIKSDRGRL